MGKSKLAEMSDDISNDRLQFLRWLHGDGDVSLNVAGIDETNRWCSQIVASVGEAMSLIATMKDFKAVYVSLHKAKPQIFGKLRLNEEDISEYQFLYIDCDRPQTKVSATEEEREQINVVCDKIARELVGLPLPLKVFTGNGYSLLYPISLKNTRENKQLLTAVIGEISKRYSTDNCHFDTAVTADAARLTGVSATMNRKHPQVVEDERRWKWRRVIGEFPPRSPMSEADFRKWGKDFIGKGSADHEQSHRAADHEQSHRAADHDISSSPLERASAEADSLAYKRLFRWAHNYLNQCDPAIEGNHGDDRTFNIAGHLLSRYTNVGGIRQFLTVEQVVDIMLNSDWCNKCSPQWEPADLRIKVESASKNGTAREPKCIDDEPWSGGEEKTPLKTTDEQSSYGDVLSTCLADIVPRPIKWLWKNRFSLGTLSMLFGDPGVGKSEFSLDFAARISAGSPMPDAPWVHTPPPPPAKVLLISVEDNFDEIVVPRLRAAGANLKNIHRHDGRRGKNGKLIPFSLEDCPQLEMQLKKIEGICLVIIDPISSFFGKSDANSTFEVRQMLDQLKVIAEQFQVSILIVAHPNKGGGKAIYRISHSLGFMVMPFN